MKCLLIPVDFSTTTSNLLQYIADFSQDFPIEEVILLKVFHISILARLYPSPDFVQLDGYEIAELRRQEELQLQVLKEDFCTRIKNDTKVEAVFVIEELLPSISFLFETKEPGLIAIGNALQSEETAVSLKEFIVPIAKLSKVPVLLIPNGISYRKIDKVILPTSFKNLELLNSFKKLAQSQIWFKAEILVLNVDNKHRHDEIEIDDEEIIGRYLEGFNYQINYSYGEDVANEILLFAGQQDVQLILALPGKHSFLYNLTHKSVTKSFALEAQFPILLLK